MAMIKDLAPNARNPRKIEQKKLEMLAKSMIEFGPLDGFIYNIRTKRLAGGHQRQKIMPDDARIFVEKRFDKTTAQGTVAQGYVEYLGERWPYREVDWDEKREMAANIAANKGAGEWDFPKLQEFFVHLDEQNFDLDLTMFDKEEYDELFDPYKTGTGGKMSDKFGAPPFSVLDARQGWWQKRKKEWLGIGLNSQEGRDENLIKYSKISSKGEKDTSIFDPVLCELMYKWFCPAGGSVIDCFAGGSVRGVVANKLGFKYSGMDLSKRQIDANVEQAKKILPGNEPIWWHGDSRTILSKAEKQSYDMLLTCPPYADLEVYSDDAADISNMDYGRFKEAYSDILIKTCTTLKDNTFACIVVGEVRDKKTGEYLGFVQDTIDAFKMAGLKYYNEIILVTAIGSLPLRAGKIFTTSRKIGKTHQNVLIFLKGDAQKATERAGDISQALNLSSSEAP